MAQRLAYAPDRDLAVQRLISRCQIGKGVKFILAQTGAGVRPVYFVFCRGRRLKLAGIIFVFCQAGYAQAATPDFVETEVKAAVEEATVLDICPDQTLLEVVDIEVGECRSHIAKLAPVCWHLIDKLVADYEIEKDQKQNEGAKNRFISITNVYASCIRGELLREIVKSRRESHTP